MEKIKVLVLFGGQSSEHSISELSASNVIQQLDREKYDIHMVGITAEGSWFLYDGDPDNIPDGLWEKSGVLTPAVLSPDASMGGLLVLKGEKCELLEVDVVFPVLHGKLGEDGTIQGLCALAGLPCVGPDMLSSAMCMDKTIAKILFQYLNIPQADWVVVQSFELSDIDRAVKKVESKLSYPVFVKPACAGSSVGVGKAKSREDLIECLFTAADHDKKILVEEFVPGREVECAVLGNRDLIVSHPGEIISAKEFYDFEAKYEIASRLQIPAVLPENAAAAIRLYAKKIFLETGLSGLSRIDFFVLENGEVRINEVNTIPGFTDISMYPKMLEADGIPQTEQLDRLINLSIEAFTGYEEPADTEQDLPVSFEGEIYFEAQPADGEKQSFYAPCSYTFDGENAVLAFFEPAAENCPPTRAKITMDAKKCVISRRGEFQSDFVFEKGTEDQYTTELKAPGGEIPLTVIPQYIDFSADYNGCTARFTYALKSDEITVLNNTIHFEVKPCE